MQGLFVFASGELFNATSLVEAQVARRKRVLESECAGDFLGHEAVSRPRHPMVELRQEKEVTFPHPGVFSKDSENALEIKPTLEVPGGGADRSGRWRGAALLFSPIEDSTQDRFDVWSQPGIEWGGFQFRSGLELAKRRDVCAQIVVKELIAHLVSRGSSCRISRVQLKSGIFPRTKSVPRHLKGV